MRDVNKHEDRLAFFEHKADKFTLYRAFAVVSSAVNLKVVFEEPDDRCCTWAQWAREVFVKTMEDTWVLVLQPKMQNASKAEKNANRKQRISNFKKMGKDGEKLKVAKRVPGLLDVPIRPFFPTNRNSKSEPLVEPGPHRSFSDDWSDPDDFEFTD